MTGREEEPGQAQSAGLLSAGGTAPPQPSPRLLPSGRRDGVATALWCGGAWLTWTVCHVSSLSPRYFLGDASLRFTGNIKAKDTRIGQTLL